MNHGFDLDLAALRSALRLLSDAGESGREPEAIECEGWSARPLPGGRNNLLYRLDGPPGSLVAKFTIRDERDRAGREYHAMVALAAAGWGIAPRPVLLDRDSYFQPLIVQEWLEGEVLRQPPETDEDWARLGDALAACHALRPGHEAVPLRTAVLTARTATEALGVVRAELAKMPGSERPGEVERFAGRLERLTLRNWPEPALTFVRCDPNLANYLRRPGPWGCVDWEYSGWGDPAWDVAQLMLHPACLTVDETRWERFSRRLFADEPGALERVEVYLKVITVWWMARLARLRYETPRGLDLRLAAPQPGWDVELENNYQHYRDLARHL